MRKVLLAVEQKRQLTSWLHRPDAIWLRALRQVAQLVPMGIIVCDGTFKTLIANAKAQERSLPKSWLSALKEGAWTELLLPDERLAQCTRLTVSLNETIYVFLLNDITHWYQWIKLIEHACLTDDLTGLYNRRGFLAVANA